MKFAAPTELPYLTGSFNVGARLFDGSLVGSFACADSPPVERGLVSRSAHRSNPCSGGGISPPHSHRPALRRASLFHSTYIPGLTRPRFRGRSLCNSLMAMEHWAGLLDNCGRSSVWISYYHLVRGPLRYLSLSAAWVRIQYLKAWAITIVIQTPQRFSIACVGIDHHGNHETSDLAVIRKPEIRQSSLHCYSAREQVLANCLVSNVSRTCSDAFVRL